jgi:trk system potassium uptake protein
MTNSNQDNLEDLINKKALSKPFWYTERILFLANLVVFVLCALVLSITEFNNPKNGQFNTFIDYLFNSVSVGTLTGLFRGDSGNYTFFGQFALLVNMVSAGIVASLVGTILLLLVRSGLDGEKKLENELKNLGLNSTAIIKFIFIDLFIIWLIGTILFKLSGTSTLWEAIFNSASHIFNDGVTALTNNMLPYRNNLPMLLSGGFLITIGGFGISIRGIFYKWFLNKIGQKKLAKLIPQEVLAPFNFAILIIFASLVLQFIGTFLIFTFEHSNPFTYSNGLYSSDFIKILNSWYMSVSSRTAGFTTFGNLDSSGNPVADMSKINDKTSFVFMILMTIGASSGSFAGGILKLTAFIYLFVYLYSKFTGQKEIKIKSDFAHFSEKTSFEANFRLIGFTSIVLILSLVLFIIESNISGNWLLFEAISAVSNTGLSLGATSLLGNFGMILIMILMIMGKIGFISFIISFFPKLQDVLEKADKNANEFPVD